MRRLGSSLIWVRIGRRINSKFVNNEGRYLIYAKTYVNNTTFRLNFFIFQKKRVASGSGFVWSHRLPRFTRKLDVIVRHWNRCQRWIAAAFSRLSAAINCSVTTNRADPTSTSRIPKQHTNRRNKNTENVKITCSMYLVGYDRGGMVPLHRNDTNTCAGRLVPLGADDDKWFFLLHGRSHDGLFQSINKSNLLVIVIQASLLCDDRVSSELHTSVYIYHVRLRKQDEVYMYKLLFT